MRKRREIPIERVRQALSYDRVTGVFRWREKIADKINVGDIAGNKTGRRDVRISIDGVLYQAHRLAWAIVTGEQPPDLIDHEDLDTRNNRWSNLRDATTSLNGANRVAQINSRSKVKGVYGVIRLNRYFPTQEEAAKAYAEAARKYFGPFWRA